MTLLASRPPVSVPLMGTEQRTHRRAWIVIGLLAAVTAIVFTVVLLAGRGAGPAAVPSAVGSSTSTTAPVTGEVISGDQLQELWATTETPCDRPITATGAPLNKYNLVGDAYITSGDVADRLRGVQARGGEDFARAKLQRLFVALLQTQSAMVADDNFGTEAIENAQGDRTAEQEAIAMTREGIAGSRDAFNAFADHTFKELAAGQDISDPIAVLFPISAVCP